MNPERKQEGDGAAPAAQSLRDGTPNSCAGEQLGVTPIPLHNLFTSSSRIVDPLL